MALFKPEKKESTGDWTGYKQMGIESITDKSDQFDWADVYLEFAMKVEGSKYPRNMYLSGSFDREDDGSLKDSGLFRRIYHVFDILGFDGGLNIKGEWENSDGTKIDDIGKTLSDKYAPDVPFDDPKMNLIGYVYREAPRKGGNGKIFTRVHHYIHHNTNEGMAFIKDRINFLRTKGFIKEASEDQINGLMGAGTVQTGPAVNGGPRTVDNVEGSVVNQL